jgi:RNA polymerase sigma-70 factor (ECF subfamily)
MNPRPDADEVDALLLALLAAHGYAWEMVAYDVLGDWHRAEDAVSEALSALRDAWLGAEEIDNPAAWMSATVRNRALKRLRSETSHRKRIESLSALPGENDAGSGEDTGEAELPEMDPEAVRAAMPGLTPRQREVIELRFFEGLTFREAAGRMGCSESRVRATQMNAIRALRKRLNPYGDSRCDPENGLLDE